MSTLQKVIRWILLIVSIAVLIAGITSVITASYDIEKNKSTFITWIVIDVIFGIVFIYNLLCIIFDGNLIRDSYEKSDFKESRGDANDPPAFIIVFIMIGEWLWKIIKWPFEKIWDAIYSHKRKKSPYYQWEQQIEQIRIEYFGETGKLMDRGDAVKEYERRKKELEEKKKAWLSEEQIKEDFKIMIPAAKRFKEAYDKWSTYPYKDKRDKIMVAHVEAIGDVLVILKKYAKEGVIKITDDDLKPQKIMDMETGLFAYRDRVQTIINTPITNKMDEYAVMKLQERVVEAETSNGMLGLYSRCSGLVDADDGMWLLIRFELWSDYHFRITNNPEMTQKEKELRLKGYALGCKAMGLDLESAKSGMSITPMFEDDFCIDCGVDTYIDYINSKNLDIFK